MNDQASTSSTRGRLSYRPIRLTRVFAIIRALLSFEFSFVLFLFAGRYKADPRFQWVPVDLTALFFGLSVIAGFYVLWRRRFKVRGQAFHVSLLMLLFTVYAAASLAWTPGSVYARQKTLYLVTLTLWSLVACAWIIAYDGQRLRRFLVWIVLIASWFAVESALVFAQSGGRRIKALGGTYLGLGRAIGSAALIILVYILFSRRGSYRLGGLIWLSGLVFVLLILGGRGPFLAAVLSACVPLLIGLRFTSSGGLKMRRYASWLLALLIIGAVTIAVVFLSTDTSLVTLARLFAIFESGGERNVIGRLNRYQNAVALWSEKPILGHGIGAWPLLVGLPDEQAYPHNMILETLMELGIVGLMLLGSVILFGLRALGSLRVIPTDPLRLLVLMLFSLSFLSAMISGDISDNRMLFGFLGLMVFTQGNAVWARDGLGG